MGSPTYQVSEDCLRNRLIEINFPTTTRRPDPNLGEILAENSAGLVNWGLTCPSEILQSQIQTGSIDPETLASDPYISFIEAKLAQDDHGIIQISELETEADSYFNPFGYDLPTGRQRRCISTIIKAFLHMYFQIEVYPGRVGNIRVLRGIRLAHKNEPPIKGKYYRPIRICGAKLFFLSQSVLKASHSMIINTV